MAVYGDMLSAFPEQFRFVKYYSMKQETPAGFTKREELGKVQGVFQFVKKGELSRENDTLSDVDVPTFWTREKLKVGNFLQIEEDEDYRIVASNNWKFEGGFVAYILETAAGNTDRQTPFTKEEVNVGGGYW